MKKPYTVRLDESLLNEIQDKADQQGETVTSIFEQALESFLSAPISKPIQSAEPIEIQAIKDRVKRLESVVLKDKPRPEPISSKPINPDQMGELVTKKESAALTGYSVNTLNRTFSQNNIFQVSQRGQAGLYSKKEILDKIGIKEN